MANYIGYHGTNKKIEVFTLDHLGSNQGQTLGPGIYFADSYEVAKRYAEEKVERFGGEPLVYIAECELEKPLFVNRDRRVFNTLGDIIRFCKKYFPDWFDSDGEILSYKVYYVKEKFSTYQGQYSLIQYAAKENRLDLIEIFNELGFDSFVDNGEFVITSPQQILSFQEVDHSLTEEETEVQVLPAEESIGDPTYYSAFETKSNDYIRAAKRGKPYKTMPGNRFLRRVRIQKNGGNNVWFDLDMNRLFKKGSFAVKVPVIGETDQYVVTISFEDWLPILKADIAKTGFNQLTVKRSLAQMMRFHDLKLRCTCPDFKYRHSYWLTVHNEVEGDPELRPSDKTNPHDDLGKICKHLSFVLNTKSVFFDKISRIIYNYFINLQRSQKALFDKIVAPKLGLDKLQEEKDKQATTPDSGAQVDEVEKEIQDGLDKEEPETPAEEPEEVVEEEPVETEEEGNTEDEGEV